MKDEASFNTLIEQMDEVGWARGFGELLSLHKSLEVRYAALCAEGTKESMDQAENLAHTIALQDRTLLKLTIYAQKNRGILLKWRH